MNANVWFQLTLYVLVLVALAKPLGTFMAQVFEGKSCGLERVLAGCERAIYRLSGVDPTRPRR